MNIGYITDVGMSWTLQHLPGYSSTQLGKFLGLTGYRMTPDDMLALGLASHKVATVDGILDQLVDQGLSSLDDASLQPDHSQLANWFDQIDATFIGPWTEIEGRLDGEFGEMVRTLTAQASPSSLVAAAELLRPTPRTTSRAPWKMSECLARRCDASLTLLKACVQCSLIKTSRHSSPPHRTRSSTAVC